MSASLIERVPDALRGGLPAPAAVPSAPVLVSRQTRRTLTDAESASLTDAARHRARERAELLAEVGDALLAGLADGVVAP